MTGQAERWWAALRWSSAAATVCLDARVRLGSMLHQPALSGGVALPVRLRSGTTIGDLVQAADKLASLYGCSHVEVVAAPGRGDLGTVVLHHERLPATRTYPRLTSRGTTLLPPSAAEPMPLGVDAHGMPVGLPLFSATGGTTLLVGGIPGTGKTVALRALLCGLAPTTASIFVIDPTGGAEAAHWGRRLSAVVADADAQPTLGLLGSLFDLVTRRGSILGAGGTIDMLAPVVLVCDELAELAAAGTPRQQDEARTLLRRIVALGRKANVTCLLATQRTTSTSIDVTTRSLAGWRLALPHPDDASGSEALLGPGRREAARLTKTDTGAGYLTNGGVPRLIRVFDTPVTLVPSLASASLGLDFDGLEGWDLALLRELTT